MKITRENMSVVSLGLILSLIRGRILKLKASKVGSLPRIEGKCIIKNHGQLLIGNNFSIRSKPLPIFITVFKNAKLVIGDNVFFNYGVDIGCTYHIEIGNNVIIGDLTNILDNSFHPVDSLSINVGKKVTISDNVWIGNHCIILPGVKIGINSVIAAGSVVSHDVPENVLVAGVPAKVIRELSIPQNWIRKNK